MFFFFLFNFRAYTDHIEMFLYLKPRWWPSLYNDSLWVSILPSPSVHPRNPPWGPKHLCLIIQREPETHTVFWGGCTCECWVVTLGIHNETTKPAGSHSTVSFLMWEEVKEEIQRDRIRNIGRSMSNWRQDQHSQSTLPSTHALKPTWNTVDFRSSNQIT